MGDKNSFGTWVSGKKTQISNEFVNFLKFFFFHLKYDNRTIYNVTNASHTCLCLKKKLISFLKKNTVDSPQQYFRDFWLKWANFMTNGQVLKFEQKKEKLVSDLSFW